MPLLAALPASQQWLSVVVPIVAIAMAVISRQVFLALLSFLWFGWTVLSSFNPITGAVAAADAFFAAVCDRDNAMTLAFSLMVGSVVALVRASGGMAGFVQWTLQRGIGTSERRVALFAVVTSFSLFLESNFGLLVTGAVARPLAQRVKMSQEKLAYLLDATCAPKQVLLPMNAWGAYLLVLLAAQDVGQPTELLLAALPLNFYAIVSILLVGFGVLTGWEFPSMRATRQSSGSGASYNAIGIADDNLAKEVPPASPAFLILPLVVMVVVVPLVLFLTGSGSILAGSGAQAVFWGATAGVGTAIAMGRAARRWSLARGFEIAVQGASELFSMVLVLALAFGVAKTQRALGTGVYLADFVGNAGADILIAPGLFLVGCAVAFSTGTSWGTFAVMVPIALPMAQSLGYDEFGQALFLAASISGGIFGDHCSPISDSTIVSSMAAQCDHVAHVRTQLPYALLAAAISLVLFFIASLFLA